MIHITKLRSLFYMFNMATRVGAHSLSGQPGSDVDVGKIEKPTYKRILWGVELEKQVAFCVFWGFFCTMTKIRT